MPGPRNDTKKEESKRWKGSGFSGTALSLMTSRLIMGHVEPSRRQRRGEDGKLRSTLEVCLIRATRKGETFGIPELWKRSMATYCGKIREKSLVSQTTRTHRSFLILIAKRSLQNVSKLSELECFCFILAQTAAEALQSWKDFSLRSSWRFFQCPHTR